MHGFSTMTTKGQVTIPKEIRDQLGLKPYDRVSISLDGHEGARLTKGQPNLRDLMGILPSNGLSVEEAMQRAAELRSDETAARYRAETE